MNAQDILRHTHIVRRTAISRTYQPDDSEFFVKHWFGNPPFTPPRVQLYKTISGIGEIQATVPLDGTRNPEEVVLELLASVGAL